MMKTLLILLLTVWWWLPLVIRAFSWLMGLLCWVLWWWIVWIPGWMLTERLDERSNDLCLWLTGYCDFEQQPWEDGRRSVAKKIASYLPWLLLGHTVASIIR